MRTFMMIVVGLCTFTFTLAPAPAAPGQGAGAGGAGEAAGATAPARGHVGAPTTLTVFADFQCPHARRATTSVQALVARLPAAVRVEFKTLTMPYHPESEIAAVAALAAHEHGVFWLFHDALFADQAHLDAASLVTRAQALGLDPVAFAADLEREDLWARVRHETAFARLLGVRSSVALFVDGRRITVPRDEAELEAAVIGVGRGPVAAAR